MSNKSRFASLLAPASICWDHHYHRLGSAVCGDAIILDLRSERNSAKGLSQGCASEDFVRRAARQIG